MNKTLKIRVFPNGKTEITTQGFTGSSCRQASEALEKALGQRVHEQLTPEFYQQTEQSVRQQQQG